MLKRIAIATSLALFITGAAQAQGVLQAELPLHRGFEVIYDDFEKAIVMRTENLATLSDAISVRSLIIARDGGKNIFSLAIMVHDPLPEGISLSSVRFAVDGEIYSFPAGNWTQRKCQNDTVCWSGGFDFDDDKVADVLRHAKEAQRSILRVQISSRSFDANLTSDEARQWLGNTLTVRDEIKSGWRPPREIQRTYLSGGE